jgi:hypothetical protein
MRCLHKLADIGPQRCGPVRGDEDAQTSLRTPLRGDPVRCAGLRVPERRCGYHSTEMSFVVR